MGFEVQEFAYSSNNASGVDMSSFLKTLNEAAPKSIFVLHASAHNPSGWDPTPEQWKEIGAIMKQRQLFPIFDSAYLGMTSGDYDKDAFAIRHFVNDLSLEVGVCLSFAKSMGLYGKYLFSFSTGELVVLIKISRRTRRSMRFCFSDQHYR